MTDIVHWLSQPKTPTITFMLKDPHSLNIVDTVSVAILIYLIHSKS